MWEAYVIEGLHNVPGLPSGSFGLYTKFHHALIDGEAASELTRALHSLSPDDVEAEDGAGVTVRIADREPSAIEIYSRAIAGNLQKLPELARFSLGRRVAIGDPRRRTGARRMVGEPARLREKLAALASGDLTSALPRLPPATRFSGAVSAHRVFEAVGVPMAELKDIRQKVGDATINDLFLTIVGGALHRYLGQRGELPATSMIAGVPMTVRGADKSRGRQSGRHDADARAFRDRRSARATGRDSRGAATAKRVSGALGKDLAMNALEHLPPPLADAVLRNVRLPKLSLLVSNVRGPDVPLYMAGARMVAQAPISIVVDGIGLNCTGFSYAGTLCICAVSCREMLPDPEVFAACLRESFLDLAKAAAEHGQRAAHRARPARLETCRRAPSARARERAFAGARATAGAARGPPPARVTH